ncbi:hypothetical protein BDR07DRAFT_1486439 [Suillus spraguei]|nr:hypothetical protein BDR07DRAFT_1486439 [Suillus spraguei]
MAAKFYPMSKPVLIEKILRSDKACAMIKSSPITEYHLNKRKLTVQWEVNGPNLVVPPNCAHPLLVLLHQHGVYVKMLTNGEPKVKEGRMGPGDLQLYTSVAAYIRDVIVAFKEEWEEVGYEPKFRSARLEFHMAMVLTGGAFNDQNLRRVKKKFNVTWNDFVKRVEVTDVTKLSGDENAYHQLICGKDENMCGLDVFPSIKHSDESLCMIERFIEDREAAWRAKKNVGELECGEQRGPTAIRGAKGEYVDSTEGKEVVDNTNGVQRMSTHEGQKVKSSQHVVQDTLTDRGECHEISETQQALAKLDVLALSTSRQINDLVSEAVPQVVESVQATRKTTETVNARTRFADVVTAQSNAAMAVNHSTTPVVAAGAGAKASNKVTGEENFQIGGSTMVDAGKGGEAKNEVCKAFLSTSVDDMQDLVTRAVMEGDGVDISKKLMVWMMRRFRTLVGIPLEEPLNGQLIQQSPDEYHDLTENDYFEALGIERLYAALVNAEESPGHLIHLAHALGRAAKETNLLSDSKPDAPCLDPLPPTTLPTAITMDTHIEKNGSVSDQGDAAGEPAHDTHDDENHNVGESAPDADENNGSRADSVRRASEVSELHASHAPTDHIIDIPKIQNYRVSQDITSNDNNHMQRDVSNISAHRMDTEAVKDRKSAGKHRNSSLSAGREGKRKRRHANSVSLSDTMYQDNKGRGEGKRSKRLSLSSGMSATALDMHAERSHMIVADEMSSDGDNTHATVTVESPPAA